MSETNIGRAIGRGASFAWIALGYLVAGALGVLVARALGGAPLWQAVLAGDTAATLVIFVFSLAFNNSSFYDPYWSVAPLVIAPALCLAEQSAAPLLRRVIVTALVGAWGLRLTYNWVRGWSGFSHEDFRYVDLRAKTGRGYWPVSLFGLHLMPTLTVFLGMLALFPALVTGTRPIGLVDGLGLLVTAGAIGIEATADEQLRAFRRESATPGRIMDRGLWSRCRHPNYLGEIGFWWGLYLFGLAADPAACAWTAAGPLWITIMFVTISIPMIDRRSLARRPGYAEHMARVPALLPRLRSRPGSPR